ncbi:MAG: tRNA (guanosine(46)-N7)-methyltransferase TrmB [Bacteroidota bacterium]|nr:tRNA (guanosine(46)-N7)-methyltransferase TrmB [Bacteroidota bacterium]MDP4225397.1 tRNA (guanosine(46)-N7)-methyltransferase TrmB [Bacteroidota bacterium]MDP4274006.1 tRNA (guanosine(46)-N7)-methyltransferase TrmB [Bacteroidota bacterium]
MAKHKLARFAQMKTFGNVLEPAFEECFRTDYKLKGKWNEQYFKNDHPIVLELGCGKGEYTVGLGKKYPLKNFIGIDIKGARMWRGAKQALEGNLTNVAFLRTRIEFINSFFAENEVSEIWITFPDPQLRKGRANKRLTSSRFLASYKQFLSDEGLIHLKTDNDFLYHYTLDVAQLNKLEVLVHTDDLYNSVFRETEESDIKTFYEQQFLEAGLSIKYLKFKLNRTMNFEEPSEK